MWMEYFPRARVHALDIKDNKVEILAAKTKPRLVVKRVNQLEKGSVARALDKLCLDLFVDDGGHTFEMQESDG